MRREDVEEVCRLCCFHTNVLWNHLYLLLPCAVGENGVAAAAVSEKTTNGYRIASEAIVLHCTNADVRCVCVFVCEKMHPRMPGSIQHWTTQLHIIFTREIYSRMNHRLVWRLYFSSSSYCLA